MQVHLESLLAMNISVYISTHTILTYIKCHTSLLTNTKARERQVQHLSTVFSSDLRPHLCHHLASTRWGEGGNRENEGPDTHISVMFSGSALLASNLGNATMPGEGLLHQILEALHWQDVGQATAALQKTRASQQKPQSLAIAGPYHLVQDIPGHQCQPKWA